LDKTIARLKKVGWIAVRQLLDEKYDVAYDVEID